MAAGGPVQDLCDEATCPICLDYFMNPVTIVECGHNFCQACLTKYWVKGCTKSSCPQCRGTVRQRNFIPNRQLKNVVEIAKKLQGQKRAREAEGLCEKHQEPLKLFCKDHEAPICVVCDRSKEHKNHKVIPQEEAFQEYKDQVEEVRKKSMAELQQIHQFLEEQEKILQAQLEEVEKEIARTRDDYMARFSKKFSYLENVTQEMEKKCQQPASEFLQDIGKTLESVSQRLSSPALLHMIDLFEVPPEITEDDITASYFWVGEARCSKPKYKEEEFPNPVDFSPELICRIKEISDRKPILEGIMKLFQVGAWQSCPDPEGDESSGVPFGIWASDANVILDPDTAHPQLLLSEDGRSVRMGHRYQTMPNNPERFDKHAFVLGREGFTAGRHFWEVVVGSEESWAVGVASKSVRRKDTFDLGPGEGIWAVGKWGGYRVLNPPEYTPLSLSQELKGIRVILNCVEGEVAFFNTETGAHIYTYSGASFGGETLLPFFYVFGEAHLRLSS